MPDILDSRKAKVGSVLAFAVGPRPTLLHQVGANAWAANLENFSNLQ